MKTQKRWEGRVPVPFEDAIQVTRPLLPALGAVMRKMEEIWKERWLTNKGRQHDLLEASLRGILKVRHLSLFNNGTTALMTACRCLGLSGEVITTPFTFPATIHALTWNSLRPVFCDIDPVTMTIDPSRIEALITPQTTGILGVHVFGHPCDVQGIQAIADRHNLRVIYDAAHAFLVERCGQGIGTFGDISMFSFHATKLFHTLEGGALTFNDDGLKPTLDLLKNFGIKSEDEVVIPGINGKMNEVQAALGLLNLDLIMGERARRRRIVEAYTRQLAEIPGIVIAGHDTTSDLQKSYQYFVVRIDEQKYGRTRDEVYKTMRGYNVFVRRHFFPLCSNYPCYRHHATASPSHLPVANQVAGEVLSLPLYGDLAMSQVDTIVDIFRSMSCAEEVSHACHE